MAIVKKSILMLSWGLKNGAFVVGHPEYPNNDRASLNWKAIWNDTQKKGYVFCSGGELIHLNEVIVVNLKKSIEYVFFHCKIVTLLCKLTEDCEHYRHIFHLGKQHFITLWLVLKKDGWY